MAVDMTVSGLKAVDLTRGHSIFWAVEGDGVSSGFNKYGSGPGEVENGD